MTDKKATRDAFFDAAAQAVLDLINSQPRSPTRDELLYTLKMAFIVTPGAAITDTRLTPDKPKTIDLKPSFDGLEAEIASNKMLFDKYADLWIREIERQKVADAKLREAMDWPSLNTAKRYGSFDPDKFLLDATITKAKEETTTFYADDLSCNSVIPQLYKPPHTCLDRAIEEALLRHMSDTDDGISG